jgi:RNA polymerase sigma factor (sigma-70 family)
VSALSSLFREHNRTLVRFINARLRNEQEANEIAQEAYVKMLQLDRCPGTASFLRHYLFRVAENLAVDRIRQRYSRSRLDQLTSIDDLFQEALAERTVLAGPGARSAQSGRRGARNRPSSESSSSRCDRASSSSARLPFPLNVR